VLSDAGLRCRPNSSRAGRRVPAVSDTPEGRQAEAELTRLPRSSAYRLCCNSEFKEEISDG